MQHWPRSQNPQSAPAVLGPQGAVRLVAQRAREALHFVKEQRSTQLERADASSAIRTTVITDSFVAGL